MNQQKHSSTPVSLLAFIRSRSARFDSRLNVGVLLGFVSFFVDAVVATLVFPLLLKSLGADIAGIWMLFTTTGALFSCSLTGVGPTVTRLVAGAAGAGAEAGRGGEEWARNSLAIRMLYMYLLLVVSVVGMLFAACYLPRIAEETGVSYWPLAIAWFGYLGGWLARAWVHRRFSVLDGLGFVGFSRLYQTVGGLANLLLLVVLLPNFNRLEVPVISFLVVALALVYTSRGLYRAKVGVDSIRRRAVGTSGLEAQLGRDSIEMLILGVSGYVVAQSCIYYVEWFLGTAAVAIFAPIVRVAALMSGAACIPANMMFPFVARAWGGRDRSAYRKLKTAAYWVGPALYLVPASMLFIFPKEVISWWLGADNFVGIATVRWLLLYGLLYTVQCGFAMPVIASRTYSFVVESLASMILVLGAVPIAVKFLGIQGVPLGIIAGMLFPSLSTIWRSVFAVSKLEAARFEP